MRVATAEASSWPRLRCFPWTVKATQYSRSVKPCVFLGVIDANMYIHTYHTIPYHIIPYHTIPYHTIPYHTIRCITLHYITLHYTALHYITLHTNMYGMICMSIYIYMYRKKIWDSFHPCHTSPGFGNVFLWVFQVYFSRPQC